MFGQGDCTPYMESEVAQIPLWQQAWAWFETNKKQALWGAGVVLAVGLVVAFVLYRRNENQVAASEALSSVPAQQRGSAAQGDLAEAYLKVAAAYPNTRAGSRALLFAGTSLFVGGKYAEARTQFERFNREYTSSPFRGEALLGIAACLNAEGKTNEAVAAYKDVIDRRLSEYALPEARFALGCLYEAQHKPELARNMFEDVERNNPYGSLGSEAGMRLEELKQKYPSLAIPVAPPPTNVPPVRLEGAHPIPAKAPVTPPPTIALPLQPQK
jgi:tetratricopeptide (TPR) repeat protein